MRRGFEAYIAAMAARHIARDRQAEANPAGRRIARGVEADERVKHPLEFGRWDARPVTQNCWLCNALVSALLLRFAEDSSLRGGASSKLAVAVEDAGVRHRRHEKIAQRPDVGVRHRTRLVHGLPLQFRMTLIESGSADRIGGVFSRMMTDDRQSGTT